MTAKGWAELEAPPPAPGSQGNLLGAEAQRLPLPVSRAAQAAHTRRWGAGAHSHTAAQYSHTSDLVISGRRHLLGLICPLPLCSGWGPL